MRSRVFWASPSTGSFTPREEQANLLEECVETFNASPSARLRSWLLPAILGRVLRAGVSLPADGTSGRGGRVRHAGALDGPR